MGTSRCSNSASADLNLKGNAAALGMDARKFIRCLFIEMKIFSVPTKVSFYLALIVLLAGLEACWLPAPARRTFPKATTAIPPTKTMLPVSTALQIARPAVAGMLYTLTIQNRLPDDIFIFVDDQYRLRVAAGSSNSYAGMPARNYVLKYCLDAGMNNCAEPIETTLGADVVLIAGGDAEGKLSVGASPPGSLPGDIPATASPSPTPEATATMQAVSESKTPVPNPSLVIPTYTIGPPSSRPGPATLTAIAPTLAAMAPTMTANARSLPSTETPLADSLDRFTITVHNRYNFALGVSIDDRHLMTVPPHKNMWHFNIMAGPHIFKFCPGPLPCIRREIDITQDTEIYISP